MASPTQRVSAPAVSGPLSPTQIMSILLHSGVDEESILNWHRCLVDTPHDVVPSWIQSSGNAVIPATRPSPSAHLNPALQHLATEQASGSNSHNTNPLESFGPILTSAGTPQQLYCPTPGCKGKWKGSFAWFVKHFKEKHLNYYWHGLEDVEEPWWCLCGDKFSTDDDLMAHTWNAHMLTTRSRTPSGN